MNNKLLKNWWWILGAYGVWFAILSGLEEVAIGKYWKFRLSLILGGIFYIVLMSRKLKRGKK